MNLNGGPVRMLPVEEGRDYFLDDNEELPYVLVKNLGHGHSANVEMIRDINTGAIFARKVFRISGSRDTRRRIFNNEVKIIQRLAKHHHIIRVFATYMSRKETGLILSPVASQGDLESYLCDFREGQCTEGGMYTLISSLGCLASGLLFMHEQHIRHKDIKPRNILIHNNSVIYTDFGYSLDHSAATGSTTTGRPDTLTKKYCAPEVQDWDPRNAKSDIFSLGCVFFEIFATIGFCDLPETSVPYNQRIEDVITLVQSSFGPVNDWFRPIGDLTCIMLEGLADLRPTAKDIVKELWTHYRGHFCPQCRHSLPGQSRVNFPPQPLDEFYQLRRTNFTTGWITSEEMISGSTLLNHINTERCLDDDLWFPGQSYSSPVRTPLEHKVSSLSDSNNNLARSTSPIQVRASLPTNANRPIYYPATPDFALLRKSSAGGHDKPQTPRASVSPPPPAKADLKALNQGATTSPLVSSPKTYAMALVGDRDRTPVAHVPRYFPCSYQNCNEVFTSESDRHVHLRRHSQLFFCTHHDCPRSQQGFQNLADFDHHVTFAHPMDAAVQTRYRCVIHGCPQRDKIWTRYDELKRHIRSSHSFMHDEPQIIEQSSVLHSPRRMKAFRINV